MSVKQMDLFTCDLPSSEPIKRTITDDWKEIASELENLGIDDTYTVMCHCTYGRSHVDLMCGTYDYDLSVRDNRNGTYTLSYLNPLTRASWDHDFSNPEDLIAEIVRIRGELC